MKSFSASSDLIPFKIKTNPDFSVFEQIRHMFGISAVVDIIIVTAVTATLVLIIQEKIVR